MQSNLQGNAAALQNKIYILGVSSTVSQDEQKGPLGNYFDLCQKDDTMGEESYELAEAKMARDNLINLLKKTSKLPAEIDVVFSGDLLNQLYSSNFMMKSFSVPFIGVYNACASFASGLICAVNFLSAGTFANVVVSASSHYSTAERQFRMPLNMGVQEKATAQRTVTGCGAALLSMQGDDTLPYISGFTIGRIIDFDQKDPAYMGGAMAPAAYDTIKRHFVDEGHDLSTYDAIFTGDLGRSGRLILEKILVQNGLDVKQKLFDCGEMIYDLKKQNVHCGGSGAGCSASVFCSYLYGQLIQGKYKKILFVPTGALLSTISSYQKQSIPSIAHAVVVERS